MVFLPGREGSPVATMIKNKMTLMINGEEGLNPCALQFVMAGYIKPNSKRALPILQEAIEAGLVPKTGAITFEIDKKKCEFDPHCDRCLHRTPRPTHCERCGD